MTPWGEDSQKPTPPVLRTLTWVPFALADFALCPFTAGSLSHEHGYMLSPGRPASESHSEGLLGTSHTLLFIFLFNAFLYGFVELSWLFYLPVDIDESYFKTLIGVALTL